MHYAAYGSNLHPTRLAKRLASAQLIGTAHLADWSLRFHKRSEDGSGKCSIVPDHGGVHFAIFEISNEDKLVLDRIEGVGSGYAEVSLNIAGYGECLSYVAEESYVDDSLRPYGWYKELVLAGARFNGFPDHYVQQIESIQATDDPDPVRGANQWELVSEVKAGN